MTHQKQIESAREYLATIADDDPSSNKFAFIKNGRITLSVEELAETLCNHVLYLESMGRIKFTANQYAETPEPKNSRCCGRCDGVHDICVGDTVCDTHNEMGCEICFGK